MSVVFDHPWLGGLFGDKEVSAIFSPKSELIRMLRVESAWTRALGQGGAADASVCDAVAKAILSSSIMPEDLRDGTTRDGLPIPALVQYLKRDLPPEQQQLVHKGLTSQDVIDTALMLAVQDIMPILKQRLDAVISHAADLKTRHGSRTMMGFTRMQAALPITAGHRIDGWLRPLTVLRDSLPELTERAAILQWGGPVGLRDGAVDGQGANFAANLGLQDPGYSWHADRLVIAEIAAFLTETSGSLGKMGQDIALMAQTGPDTLRLHAGGGSSAMPHKKNPVLAELLVTLARFNAASLGAIHQSLVHEQERSGSAWTLEWMILPDMIRVTARSLSCASETLGQIDQIGQ